MGHVTWDGEGAGRKFVSCGSGFHPEIGRVTRGETVMICDACDHIQPD